MTGAMSFYALTFQKRARDITQENAPCQTEVCDYNESLIFGGITVISGIFGFVTGVEIAKRYKKYNSHDDTIVCVLGMLGSAIFLFLVAVFGNISPVATHVPGWTISRKSRKKKSINNCIAVCFLHIRSEERRSHLPSLFYSLIVMLFLCPVFYGWMSNLLVV
ncbi:protein spinster homolog 1-like [Ranitomeya variabilis]|uniref:protein spinster homolog 1-like n=1 Tax=Ranitomeya variabilis TaxID=490064 RepID=UPI0040572372